MKIKLISDEVTEKTFEGKTRRFRRLVGLPQGDFSEQFVEIELPEAHPPVGTDKIVDFQVKMVTSIYMGKAKLSGNLLGQPK